MSDIYSTPESDLSSETNIVNYAGFWIRVVAGLIDTVLILLLVFALGWAVYGASYFESTDLIMGYVDGFISYILPFIITMLFWIYRSATPGKMILGLKIVDAESLGPVSKGRLALRYIGYYPSTIVLMLGIFWVAWDPRKQGWHDKMARTVVVKAN